MRFNPMRRREWSEDSESVLGASGRGSEKFEKQKARSLRAFCFLQRLAVGNGLA